MTQETDSYDVVDVKDDYPNAFMAERRGDEIIIVHKLKVPVQTLDGLATYAVQDTWLVSANAAANRVSGSMVTYYTEEEVEEILDGLGLFEFFDLPH